MPPMSTGSERSVVLVGGAGLIGSALSVRLAKQGVRVVVVDDLSVNNLRSEWDLAREGVNRPLYESICEWRLHRMEAAGVTWIDTNARNANGLLDVVRAASPDVIAVLAAVSHASRSNADPQRAFENGEEVLQASLEAARLGSVPRLVYMSSSMVIGDFPTPVVDEEVRCDPMGIYGALKLGGEILTRTYSRLYGFEHTIIRPAAAYGPGCIGRRFIQASVESALGAQPISIPGDGSEIIDFTFIMDLATGLEAAMFSAEAANNTFNLTAGNARSLREVAEIICELIPGTSTVYRERSALVPKRGTLSITKAHDTFGYEPEVDLREGIARYIEWYRELTTGREELLEIKESVIND